MSYAPPPGPHGGIPGQRQWGAAPSPQAYRGPARPRKFLVVVVGLLVSAAALAGIAATVLWWDNTSRQTGFTDTNITKDQLPGPRGLGTDLPPSPAAASAGGRS